MSATPPHFERREVFGPFHRRISETTQNPTLMREILETGVLGGRAPRGSFVPYVKAHFGPLQTGDLGFEFYALVAPDRPWGAIMYWGLRDDGTVWGDDDEVRMNVLVRRVTQAIA